MRRAAYVSAAAALMASSIPGQDAEIQKLREEVRALRAEVRVLRAEVRALRNNPPTEPEKEGPITAALEQSWLVLMMILGQGKEEAEGISDEMQHRIERMAWDELRSEASVKDMAQVVKLQSMFDNGPGLIAEAITGGHDARARRIARELVDSAAWLLKMLQRKHEIFMEIKRREVAKAEALRVENEAVIAASRAAQKRRDQEERDRLAKIWTKAKIQQIGVLIHRLSIPVEEKLKLYAQQSKVLRIATNKTDGDDYLVMAHEARKFLEAYNKVAPADLRKKLSDL